MSKTRYLKIVVLFFFILSCSSTTNSVFAQRVGLVLSGGGAKGLVHIGVIRALEENNIPIDYIAGTSIGAIVGGLYAAGYSPLEMEQIVLSEEFLRWSKGLVEEKYIYYFKRKDPDASMLNIDFADDSLKLQLPSNFIPTHQMDLALIQLVSRAIAHAAYNFDSLFVPFRCVAADIQAGKAAILREGDLAMAIRASMTYPLYFDPIKINGAILFDGGIYNNFPLDVMKDHFSPDIIIGVAAASNYKKPLDNNIVLQIERMFMDNVSYSIPDSLGIILNPDAGEAGLLDFHKANELLFAGYVAADSRMEEIRKLVSRRVDPNELANRRMHFRKTAPHLVFNNIYIDGLTRQQRTFVNRSIRHSQAQFSFEQFKTEFFKLNTDVHIASIYPQAMYDSNTGFFDLYLKVKRKPKLNASIGGNISSSNINQLFASIQYNLLARQAIDFNANVYAGRFYSSVKLASRIEFPTNIPCFIAPGITYNRWDFYRGTTELFFEDVRPAYIIRNEYNFRLDAGFPVSTSSKVFGGGALAYTSDQYYQTVKFTRTDTVDQTDFNLYTFHLTFEKSTLNNIQYADEGWFLRLQARILEGQEIHLPGSTSLIKDKVKDFHQWTQLRLTYENYFKFNNIYTLGYYLDINYSNQDLFFNYVSSILMAPVFEPTPHSKTLYMENYHANNFAGLGMRNILHYGTNLSLRLEGYVFQPFEKIILGNPIDKTPAYSNFLEFRHYMYSAVLVYQTLAGPASISLNYYDKEGQALYVLFNFGYTLFNKRGID